MFFVRGWDVYPPVEGYIPNDGSYLEFKGRNLLYLPNVRARMFGSSQVTTGNFTTLGINITFRVENNTGC